MAPPRFSIRSSTSPAPLPWVVTAEGEAPRYFATYSNAVAWIAAQQVQEREIMRRALCKNLGLTP